MDLLRLRLILPLMLALTRLDGVTVWIDSDQIVSVTSGGDGFCEPHASTSILTTQGRQCVKESAHTVAMAVDNAKTHGKND